MKLLKPAPNAERCVQEHVAVLLVHAIRVHPELFHIAPLPAADGPVVGTDRHSGNNISVSSVSDPPVSIIELGSAKEVVSMISKIGIPNKQLKIA